MESVTSFTFRTAKRLMVAYERLAPLEKELGEALAEEDGARLCGQLGISQQYLSDIRRGRRNISQALVAKIVKAGG